MWIFCAVTLILILNTSSCWEYDYEWELDPPVHLQIPGYDFPLHGRVLRDTIYTLPMIASQSDKSCIDLQYGLKSLNYGVNKYFFASHPSERPSVTAEVFDFNCLEPEVPGEKQIPLEITSYIPQHQSNTFDLTKSYTTVEELKEIKNFLGPTWPLVANRLPILSFYEQENIATLAVTSNQVEVAQVKFSANLVPNSYVQQAYANLPDDYLRGESEYYQFIKSFGTHHRVSAKLGGVLSVFHKTLKSEIPERGNKLLFSVSLSSISFNYDGGRRSPQNYSRSTDTYTLGGHLGNKKNFDDWENSTLQFPAVIDGEYIPLHLLFNTTEKRKEQFAMMLKNEELHFRLQETLTIIENLRLKSSKFRFLKEVLQHELKFVTPHPLIEKLYNHGLFEIHDKWNLDCRHYPHWNKKGDWWEGATRFNLLPGVCVTPKEKPVACDSGVDVWFGKTITCVVFYELPNCLGEGRSASHEQEIKRFIPSMRSYSTCRGHLHTASF